jgi:hypothetical protein
MGWLGGGGVGRSQQSPYATGVPRGIFEWPVPRAARKCSVLQLKQGMFDILKEREERVTLCLWRTYVLVLIGIKLCYTD